MSINIERKDKVQSTLHGNLENQEIHVPNNYLRESKATGNEAND